MRHLINGTPWLDARRHTRLNNRSQKAQHQQELIIHARRYGERRFANGVFRWLITGMFHYVSDILQYVIVSISDLQYPIYLKTTGIFVISLHHCSDIDRDVVAIALSYFDRYLACHSSSIHETMFQLVAMTSLFLAAKIHSTRKISVHSIVSS